jgi:L-ribulose-5-phosphate 3-epimerase
MPNRTRLTRRDLFKTAAVGTVVAGLGAQVAGSAGADTDPGPRIPLKIGIRAASMQMVGDFDVIKTAAGIPGLRGVELQTTAGKVNLRDGDVVRRYKKEADRWGMRIPSLSGVWDRGVNVQSPAAHESLIKTIRAAELLGSSVILLAFFRQNAPDMTSESSYGPVVDMLKKTAKAAADAGVTMGLENSLSPADNKKLVDLVDHPAVGVYYDPHNMDYYGHGEEAISGIKLLGKERLSMVHVKNGSLLLEQPGPIDWAAAFREFNDIGYGGWYVYETAHEDTADCIQDTKKNNAFLKKHVQMPKG